MEPIRAASSRCGRGAGLRIIRGEAGGIRDEQAGGGEGWVTEFGKAVGKLEDSSLVLRQSSRCAVWGLRAL